MLCMKLAEEGQRLSEHFQAREFACSCLWHGAGAPRAGAQLEGLRNVVGAPVYIASGYRCAICNTTVGGAENSYHMFGMAADVWVEGISSQLAEVAENIGFDGIGVYPDQGFVHVDVRGYQARWEG